MIDVEDAIAFYGLGAAVFTLAGVALGVAFARRRNRVDVEALSGAAEHGYSLGWWHCRQAVEGLRLTDGDLSLVRHNLNRREAERSRGL